MYDRRSDCSGSDDGNLCVILLMVEASLFGLFTLCMMGDQSTVVTTNQTQIDRLKKARHDVKVGFIALLVWRPPYVDEICLLLV